MFSSGFKGPQQRRQVMSGKVCQQRRQRRIVARVDQRGDNALIANHVMQPLAPGRAALKAQRGKILIGASVDEMPQPLAARLPEGSLLQCAILQHHHIPAEIFEHGFEPLPQALADHRVERLAVIIDHPPAIAHALLPALQQRLENIALVHLCVAD